MTADPTAPKQGDYALDVLSRVEIEGLAPSAGQVGTLRQHCAIPRRTRGRAARPLAAVLHPLQLMSRLEVTGPVLLAVGPVIDAEHAGKLAEMGKIGLFFGSRDNAAVWIAGFLILLALLGLALLAWLDASLRLTVAQSFGALVAGSLGYIFGSGTGNRKRSSD